MVVTASTGTEAILDLVGFREDNVLPVAAFYGADINCNYLAEVRGRSILANCGPYPSKNLPRHSFNILVSGNPC